MFLFSFLGTPSVKITSDNRAPPNNDYALALEEALRQAQATANTQTPGNSRLLDTELTTTTNVSTFHSSRHVNLTLD